MHLARTLTFAIFTTFLTTFLVTRAGATVLYRLRLCRYASVSS